MMGCRRPAVSFLWIDTFDDPLLVRQKFHLSAFRGASAFRSAPVEPGLGYLFGLPR